MDSIIKNREYTKAKKYIEDNIDDPNLTPENKNILIENERTTLTYYLLTYCQRTHPFFIVLPISRLAFLILYSLLQ